MIKWSKFATKAKKIGSKAKGAYKKSYKKYPLATGITTVSAGQYSQVKEGSYPSEVTSLGPGGSMDGIIPGPAKPIDDLSQRTERGLDDDWLDRIEETNELIGAAENAIDAIKTKTLTLSMTFTNR